MEMPILFYSPSSPYARKVLVHMHELAVIGQYQLEAVNQLKDTERLRRYNPLAKIPALVVEEGQLIADSRVICRYLIESQLGSEAVYIESFCSTFEAICDGVMDSAFSYVMETMRQDAEQSVFWKQRWIEAIENALSYLESNLDKVIHKSNSDLAQVALACALGYVDFRLTDFEWRKSRKKLASWFAEFSQRPSMQATAPANLV